MVDIGSPLLLTHSLYHHQKVLIGEWINIRRHSSMHYFFVLFLVSTIPSIGDDRFAFSRGCEPTPPNPSSELCDERVRDIGQLDYNLFKQTIAYVIFALLVHIYSLNGPLRMLWRNERTITVPFAIACIAFCGACISSQWSLIHASFSSRFLQ